MRRVYAIGLALTGALAGSAQAASEPGESAYHFLNLGAGARTEALGEAGTALAEGPDALAWNPALLASLKGPGASASWFNWLQDVQAGHFAAAAPVGRGGVGFSARSLSVADFSNVDGQDAVGQSDLALGLGGAYPVLSRLDAGASIQMVRSSLADTDATGWAVDAGLNYRHVEGWNAAVAVRNSGPAFGYGSGLDEQLPTQTAVGIGGTLGELRLGAEGLWENGPGWRGVVGLEYPVAESFALRAGSRIGEDPNRAADPWSVGMGLRVRPGVHLDYAFRNGDFDPSHRLGVRWTLERTADEGAEENLALSPREYYVSVLNEVIDQALETFPRDQRELISVRGTDLEHRATPIIAEAVVSRLRDLGMEAEIRQAAPAIPNTGNPEADAQAEAGLREAGLLDPVSGPLLEFEIRESEYAILSEKRARWIGPRAMDREVRLDLGFRLMPGEGEDPQWTSQGAGSRSEFVLANHVPASEGYPRAKGTVRAESAGPNPWVEPAIVGGIVSGLAVIFFANRNVGD